MATKPIVEGVNNQVTIYKNGAVSTAQEGRREGESASELDRRLADGWSTTPSGSGGQRNRNTNTRTVEQGFDIATAMYSFMPESVLKAYADAWVKSGDKDVAIGMTRQSKSWKDNFGKLMREDGSLVMDELSFMSVKASYRQTLAEVGVSDFTDFEDEFVDMATGYGTDDPVSAEEFQTRIDMVYAGVKDQIPEVEKLFRERYSLPINQGTVFAALINPKVQDKVLKGDIATLQLQAEASSRGFTQTFARFQELRNLGLTQQAARGLYESASGMMSQARGIGRDLTLETLEDASLGDIESQQRMQRISAELQSQQGLTLGAVKKGDEITGLIAD